MKNVTRSLCHQTLSSTTFAHNSWTIQDVTEGGKSRTVPLVPMSLISQLFIVHCWNSPSVLGLYFKRKYILTRDFSCILGKSNSSIIEVWKPWNCFILEAHYFLFPLYSLFIFYFFLICSNFDLQLMLSVINVNSKPSLYLSVILINPV